MSTEPLPPDEAARPEPRKPLVSMTLAQRGSAIRVSVLDWRAEPSRRLDASAGSFSEAFNLVRVFLGEF